VHRRSSANWNWERLSITFDHPAASFCLKYSAAHLLLWISSERNIHCERSNKWPKIALLHQSLKYAKIHFPTVGLSSELLAARRKCVYCVCFNLDFRSCENKLANRKFNLELLVFILGTLTNWPFPRTDIFVPNLRKGSTFDIWPSAYVQLSITFELLNPGKVGKLWNTFPGRNCLS
jgi:hypothetical protein